MTEATLDELVDYFNEHVFYELLMLRYSKQRLENGGDQLLWNAMFAAFNVSARNLYYFVGKRDGANVNVADYRTYCQTFDRGSIEDVKNTLESLNAQCLHLGRKRYKEAEKKINLDKIRAVSAWIESRMDNLLKSFNNDFRSKLRPEWAGLVAQQPAIGVDGPKGPSARSVPSNITTRGPTGNGDLIQFDLAPKM
jgi:hypothetical protein